jgi:hypothetical protein
MNLINTRNRYRIETPWNSSTSKVFELFFYYPGESIPTIPQYQLEKKKYSNEILPAFDLSKFANDYLLTSPWKPTTYSTAADEGNGFVNCRVVIKDDDNPTPISTTDYGLLYGYEANSIDTSLAIPLYNSPTPIRLSNFGTAPVLLSPGNYRVNFYTDIDTLFANTFLTVTSKQIYNIQLGIGSPLTLYPKVTVSLNTNITPLVTFLVDRVFDCNTTGRLTFRNSFGGISYIDINGNITTSINTERNKFEFKENIRGRAVDNRESYQTYTINTGWIPEKYNSLIESLFISPLVYIDDARIILDGSSLQMQTRIKEGLINYTFQGTNVLNFADY